MNPIDTMFEWLLAATLRASVLAVVILLIQMILRRWLPAGWRHAMWLPMLAVLVLPVLPEASFGLFPKAAEQPTTFDITNDFAEFSQGAVTIPEISAKMDTASTSNAVSKVNYFAIAWLVGACGFLAAGIIGYRQNMLRIRTNAMAPDRMLQASIDDAAREVGLKRAPQTLISSSVASPAVTGFGRPILLLPAGFPEGFSAAEVRLILLHEFTHLKRFDLPLNWLVCVLQAAHWFNPLLWFAFARMRTDREAACDASVLSIDAKDHRSEYGNALLKLQCMTPSRVLNLGFVGIFERGSGIQSRIKEISAHRPSRFVWQAVGGSIVTLLMVFGVTKAQQAGPLPKEVAEPEVKVSKEDAIVENKLRTLIIPRINFEDVPFDQAIEFIRMQSIKLDPVAEGKGLNFVIRPLREGEVHPNIKELILENVPLGVALKYCCDQSNYRYDIENGVVVFTDNTPTKLIHPVDNGGGANSVMKGNDKESVITVEKLKNITIQNINFQGNTIKEAIDFLRLRAAELDVKEPDPLKKGVNFVILDKGTAPDGLVSDRKVKELIMRNVSLGVVLKHICDQTNLNYSVEGNVVTLTPLK